MRKTVTIPAPGTEKRISMTGFSVIVESASLYDSVEDVPLLAFDSGDSQRPIYPRSTYLADSGKFNSIVLTGTTESEGDEITLLSLEECLDSEILIAFRDSFQPTLKATFTKTANDGAQSLSALELKNANDELPVKISVWVKGGATSGINYAFDAAPSQGISATDAGYLDNEPTNKTASQDVAMFPLEISGINFILAFKFIAAVLGETPTLVIQCEY